MKKSLLLVLLASTTLASSMPAFSQGAAQPAASDNKFKTAGKKIGNGIMWGPKKVGAGLKKMGAGAKKMVGK
ncbi:MAG TPA: hypothetical protein V6C76_07750 [Drouetiella sp.]